MGQYGTVQKRRFQDGVERWTWEKRVPRIPDELTDSIIGLYKTVAEAKAQSPGKGGSGFITAVSDEIGGELSLYAVTNRHVAQSCPVVRIHATEQVLDLTTNNWHFEASTPDLAVCLLDVDSPLIQPIHRGHFLSANIVLQQLNIGLGDDVFMLGRYHPAEHFSIHDPTARFGNIALWPSRHVAHPKTLLPEESFLVEMRSQNGCSGSPVFVIVESGSPRPLNGPPNESSKGWRITGMSAYTITEDRRVAFLGVDWGHLPDKGGTTLMALVVPDHQLVKLLDSKELVEQRKELREKKSKEKEQPTVVLDYQEEPSFTKEDFEDALKKASRRLEPDK